MPAHIHSVSNTYSNLYECIRSARIQTHTHTHTHTHTYTHTHTHIHTHTHAHIVRDACDNVRGG